MAPVIFAGSKAPAQCRGSISSRSPSCSVGRRGGLMLAGPPAAPCRPWRCSPLGLAHAGAARRPAVGARGRAAARPLRRAARAGTLLDRAVRRSRDVVDRSAHDHHQLRRRADADVRHRAGQRRRRALLDGPRRAEGRARSAGLLAGGQLGGADGAARHHRAHDARRSAARPRADRGASCSGSSTSARTRGASPCRRSRCATSSFPARCRTRCRARRRPRARSRRASSSARRRWKSPTPSQEAAKSYQDNPTALHLRAMNMLYEGLKEKGALMLIPSSAVESMGMGGMLGAAALRQSTLTGGNEQGPSGVDLSRLHTGGTRHRRHAREPIENV